MVSRAVVFLLPFVVLPLASTTAVRSQAAIGSHASPFSPTARGSSKNIPARFWHPSQWREGGDCDKCANGSSCCGGEHCCSDSSCCPSGSTCCGDVCCETAVQSCCPDPKNGGVCCEKEGTQCCPPDPVTGMASRCCPRDFVCCPGGRFGCCDPGLVGPGGSGAGDDNNDDNNGASGTAPAVALMTMANLHDSLPLVTFPFSAGTGERGADSTVRGFNNYGESTRPWHYSHALKAWVLVRANFTGPVNGTELNLYVVSASGGGGSATDATVARVTGGPTGLVTGMAIWTSPSTGAETIVIGTRYYESGLAKGYLFSSVDASTGVATEIARRAFPSGVDDYSGYFRKAVTAPDGAIVVYRVGYEAVVAEKGPGVGFTYLGSTGGAQTSFVQTIADGYMPFIDANLRPASGSSGSSGPLTMLSLAAKSSMLGGGDLGLFSWQVKFSVNAGTGTAGGFKAEVSAPQLLTGLGNAHTTPKFGPIGSSVSRDGSTFAGLVVRGEIDSTYDLWEVVTVALAEGTADEGRTLRAVSVTAKDLRPVALAETNGLSGFSLTS